LGEEEVRWGLFFLDSFSLYDEHMATVPGLQSLCIETISVPEGYTFNLLVLQFEDGNKARVPVTEATAAEIRNALQSQQSLRCKDSSELSPLCPGCPLCDPASEG
jgi:hypothetical protein